MRCASGATQFPALFQLDWFLFSIPIVRPPSPAGKGACFSARLLVAATSMAEPAVVGASSAAAMAAQCRACIRRVRPNFAVRRGITIRGFPLVDPACCRASSWNGNGRDTMMTMMMVMDGKERSARMVMKKAAVSATWRARNEQENLMEWAARSWRCRADNLVPGSFCGGSKDDWAWSSGSQPSSAAMGSLRSIGVPTDIPILRSRHSRASCHLGNGLVGEGSRWVSSFSPRRHDGLVEGEIGWRVRSHDLQEGSGGERELKRGGGGGGGGMFAASALPGNLARRKTEDEEGQWGKRAKSAGRERSNGPPFWPVSERKAAGGVSSGEERLGERRQLPKQPSPATPRRNFSSSSSSFSSSSSPPRSSSAASSLSSSQPETFKTMNGPDASSFQRGTFRTKNRPDASSFQPETSMRTNNGPDDGPPENEVRAQENADKRKELNGSVTKRGSKEEAPPPPPPAAAARGQGGKFLVGKSLEELQQLAVDYGEQKYRGKQLHHFLYSGKGRDFMQVAQLPLAFRQRLLDDGWVAGRSPIHTVVTARDGTAKLLLRLEDDLLVETVGIPSSEGRGKERLTVCVSSQVGCPMRCTFCATGKGGFARSLKAHEIVDQVLAVEELYRHRVSNVVFMGMGEPLLNLAAVVKAHRCLNKDIGIGQRMMTISTVGVPNAIAKLATYEFQSTLAVSLHAPNQELREKLVPSAKAYPLSALLDDCRHYFLATKRRISFEYALMAGVNDLPEHAVQLASLLKSRHLDRHVNLIPYNPIEDSDFRRPTKAAVMAFARRLEDNDVTVSIRVTRGLDANAACGQLRNSHQKFPLPSAPPAPVEIAA
ncbi:hypothetical protein CBR_g41638 [Chara braunii]|uniref:Radical SAM core domain-containing protein n=1 Tax=Chara braunii TaxID=69332 RepID=A0A388LW93_CHABU|nr:hypothetical protein CBR_g41638 [Chara braunii]|eukprot:GBG86576.1 hypothetical protein CBR_g41638 [Chara braunii]